MLKLGGSSLQSLPVVGLERVQDLIKHDGPLLTHYSHHRGDHYLYYWCDCDECVDRWMLLSVSETSILRLIDKVVPLDLVVPAACLDDFVYIVDVANSGRGGGVRMVPLNAVPEDYRPGKGVYLDSPEVVVDQEAQALAMRRQWMQGMGLSEEEIEEHCATGPASIEEEWASLQAMHRMRDSNG